MAKKRDSSLSITDKRVLKAFGERVRDVRKRKGLTVYDVTGDDMGVKHASHWRLIEYGRKNISLTTVVKVAECLGVTAEELLKGIKS